MKRVPALITAAAAVGMALTGCSQLASLQQVSGVPVTTLTIASNTVLVEKKIPVKVAPVCEENEAASTLECKGSTLDGKEILVHAATPPKEKGTLTIDGQQTDLTSSVVPLDMTITIGGQEIFKGTAQSVIEAAQKGS